MGEASKQDSEVNMSRFGLWQPAEKYGSKRVSLDGYSFASKLEAALYQQIKIDPELELEKVQDHLKLSAAGIIYIADFRVRDKRADRVCWYEAKGFETMKWPVIKRLWKAYGPGPLRIFKGTYRSMRMVEEIMPKGET